MYLIRDSIEEKLHAWLGQAQRGGPLDSRSCPSVALYLYEPSDGGLDRVAILFANYLTRRGVATELWMARMQGPLAGLIDPEVVVRKVRSPRWSRRLSMIAQAPGLSAMVRRYRPDILYSAGNQSNMLVAFAALGTATGAVGRISNPIVRPDGQGVSAWLRLQRFRLIARLSRMTIVMGQADKALLAGDDRGMARKILLLPRPTVTPMLEAAGRSRSSIAGHKRWELLSVGRLVPQKDHRTTLAALARITSHDWRLRIAGKGPLLADLRRQCVALGIADRVEFLGFVEDPATLADLYAQSDLLVQSSLWEGLGGTVIEALACGCGTVITDSTPNFRDILARAGQPPMVPAGDVAALARAIEGAMAKPVEPSRLCEAVRDFRVDAAFEAHIEAFCGL